MTNAETKRTIQQALHSFAQGNLKDNALALFETLGYTSPKQLDLVPNTTEGFVDVFDPYHTLDAERAMLEQWQTVDVLFQLTADEIGQSAQISQFTTDRVDNTIIESYLFLAIALDGDAYTRTQLARLTREINKQFPMPVLILFQYGPCLTLSVINRRLHQRDAGQDVLEKVTLIKDIHVSQPHRAHLEILFDLALPELHRRVGFSNFVELHRAWQTTLDSTELNKRFFQEVANWYFWAVQEVTFPQAAGPNREVRNAVGVIRLITRLIFVWFIKEKGLVPDDLFNPRRLKTLLNDKDPNGSTYYKAILQNLFFATLNQEMNSPAKPDNRKFRHKAAKKGGRDQHYMIHNLYRYEAHFNDPAEALALFSTVPFLNGGLFECLDKRDPDRPDRVLRIDGFSDHPKNELVVPDVLFFAEEQAIDLNDVYGTRNKRYKVRGLIDILSSYKFTITENTPIEEEIALDPELLGKVFENLLAAYNPETETTARKQTGSFYTPREIVNYMVDESLVAYLESQFQTEERQAEERQSSTLTKTKQAEERQAEERQSSTLTKLALSLQAQGLQAQAESLQAKLRHLLAYNEEPHQFRQAEVTRLIEAIDNLKILDPAAGSGAFPMGILHKLVFILAKLDPGNERWKERQIEKAAQIQDAAIRERAIEDIEETFTRNELDYGRKLYLIENCIYGVDIQPIAVQIAKLRFFISLVVDQTLDDGQPNRGIRPLPNLETRFVAANTLLGIERPPQMAFKDPAIDQKEQDLEAVRHRYFTARTPQTKEKYRQRDAEIREAIGQLLKGSGFRPETTEKLAQWNPYDQNATADFFDPEWMFGLEAGFDIVIGNPPYVRQEKIKALKPAFQQLYECYTGIADLYVYFFERGFKALKPGGVLTYISSNKYFRAGYGEKLRHYLSRNGTIRQLIDFGDAPVFTAIAYPSIIIIRKAKPNGHRLRALTWEPGPDIADFPRLFAAGSFLMPQQALTADGWRLESPDVLKLLDKLRDAGVPLGEYVNGRFYRGILTGYNQAFVIDQATRDRLIAEHPSSAEIIKPFLRGRDVKRWAIEFAEQYLIKIESSENKRHAWSGKTQEEAEAIFEQTYPAVYAWFADYRKSLMKRWDQGKYFWELRACAYWQAFDQPKILYPDIYEHQSFAWDEVGFYAINTCYFIPSGEKWLAGLLNSTTVEWFYSLISNKVRGGYLRAFSDYMQQIPIPTPTQSQQSSLEAWVSQILAAKQANPAADVAGLEREIDRLVYALYGLTDEEIGIVEGAVG